MGNEESKPSSESFGQEFEPKILPHAMDLIDHVAEILAEEFAEMIKCQQKEQEK